MSEPQTDHVMHAMQVLSEVSLTTVYLNCEGQRSSIFDLS